MDHAATVRRIYDLIGAGDIDGFGRYLADDFVDHEELPGLAPTKDGVLTFFRMQLAAFPDTRMDVQDIVASGDKVVARVRYKGTDRGGFMGAPATGKSISRPGVTIYAMSGAIRLTGDEELLRMLRKTWGVLFEKLKSAPPARPGVGKNLSSQLYGCPETASLLAEKS